MSLWKMVAVLSLFALPSQAFALDRAGVDKVRTEAVRIVQEKGIEAGAKHLGDSANGMIDLKGPGLHTWSVSRQGLIKFDLSGQTSAGMDISDLRYPDGRSLIQRVFEAADKQGGSGFDDATAWPHPVTGVMSNSYMSCGTLPSDKDVAVCAMAWID